MITKGILKDITNADNEIELLSEILLPEKVVLKAIRDGEEFASVQLEYCDGELRLLYWKSSPFYWESEPEFVVLWRKDA